MRRNVLLSWSSGKDSAWTLHVLRQQPDVAVCGLLTTLEEESGRVTAHGVRRELVEAQADAAGLPLQTMRLPYPCPNPLYEAAMREAVRSACRRGITHLAFGDLFLEDIRDYRTQLLSGSGASALFPLWCSPQETPELAGRMISSGLRSVLTSVDSKQLGQDFAGRLFDEALLSDLPPQVDPCGERGEFHSFCFDGPMFASPIGADVGRTARQGDRWIVDLSPVGRRPIPPRAD